MTALDAVLLATVALFGAIVGSFLNVVVHRLPRGTFFSAGARSVCANPDCRTPIPWHDNVPILGWLMLRGRARCCGQPISGRYPLIEALTAGLFVALWWIHPAGPVVEGRILHPTALFAWLLQAFFVANLIANTFIDIEHRILPDVLTKSAMVVGLVGALLVPGLAGRFAIAGLSPAADSLVFSTVGLAAGYGLTQAVRLSARWAFRRDAMGYGDVKLMAAIGAFLGWQGVLLSFFLGCVLGAVVGLVHRQLTGDAYIFFGPFLAAGALISLLAGGAVVDGWLELQDWMQASRAGPAVVLMAGVVSIVLLVVLVRRGRAS